MLIPKAIVTCGWGRGASSGGLAHIRCTVHVSGMRSSLTAWRPCPALGWCMLCPREAGWVGAGGGESRAGGRRAGGRGLSSLGPVRVPPVCLSREFCVVPRPTPRCRLGVRAPVSLSGSHPHVSWGLASWPAAFSLSLQLPIGSCVSRSSSSPPHLADGRLGPFWGAVGSYLGMRDTEGHGLWAQSSEARHTVFPPW